MNFLYYIVIGEGQGMNNEKPLAGAISYLL